MLRILCVTNSFPIHPRLEKIGNTFTAFNDKVEVKFFAWDRNGIGSQNEKYEVFRSNIGYSNKVLKLINIRKFEKSYKGFLDKYKPQIVIARFWDMAFIALKYKRKYKYKLIYDVNDMPLSNNLLKDIIYRTIEKKALENSDYILLSSRYFQDFYKKFSSKISVIENYPENSIKKECITNEPNRMTIGFIGGISYYQEMKNLCDAAKGIDIDIKFFGDGKYNKKLCEYCKTNNIKNVEFLGRYNYSEISRFYHMSDIIWAAYPYKNKNVRYAIPNKFFESIFFDKPIVASMNTMIGEYVKREGIGFIIDPYSIGEINTLLEDLLSNRLLILDKIKNIKDHKKYTWDMNIPVLNAIYNSIWVEGKKKND